MKSSRICIVSFLLILFVSVINLSAQCPKGDIDGNGIVGIEDLMLFAQQWLDPAGCVGHSDDCADLIGNDGVNSGDFAVLAANWQQQCEDVRITEIHYDPDVRIELVEFVELHNAGANDLDISGWSFKDGIDFKFDADTILPGGGYIVVAHNPASVISKYGVAQEKVYGPFVGKLSNEGEEVDLCNEQGITIDRVNYGMGFPWPTVGYTVSDLDEGNGNSIQLINTQLDNDLGGSWRSGYPTPGANNTGVWADNAPPQIRKVNHTPEQPKTGEAITFTAKATDPDGVNSVSLSYQIVTPGNYIPAILPLSHSVLLSNPDTQFTPNPAFENPSNWTTITMADDGKGNDEFADDDIFTATLTLNLMNRTLVRYRITVEDNNGNSVRVPYTDDPSLNFAAYVYDGVPDYVAETRSVAPGGAGYVHDSEIMTSLPVYSLLARADDMTECVAYNSADRIGPSNDNARRKFNWPGTFIYDGKVFDHVLYRLRGVNQRYAGKGKRSMRIRFNRGNYLQARDNFGKKYPTKWRTLNIGKGCDNLLGNGNFGLNERLNNQLFNIVGIPAPYMHQFHFRVVDDQQEAPSGTNGQYYGDFWGLYTAMEDYDARFIDAHNLADGNLYKLKWNVYDGNKQKRFQGIDSTTDDDDFQNIRLSCDPDKSVEWLRTHVDLDHWYRYNTICEMVKHRDYNPSDGWLKNRAWFFEPYPGSPYGRLKTLPHDSDGSWANNAWNGKGDYPEEAIYADHPGFDDKGDMYYYQYVGTWPPKEELMLEHRNVMREFRDLLWTEEQILPLLADLAALISDFVPADRDRWKDAPSDAGYQDWGSMESKVASMKSFAFGNARDKYIDNTFVNAHGDAAAIPNTPAIAYTGPDGHPANSLTFETSAFSDPQGNGTFAAMKWRIAEVDPTEDTPDDDDEIELLATGDDNWKYFKGTKEPSATGLWRLAGFNENSEWIQGQTSIGYGDNDDATIINDMQNSYWSIYLRNTFEVSNPQDIEALKLDVYVDDGCIIWINGTEVARPHVSSGEKAYNDSAINHNATWEIITLTNIEGLLVQGENTIAVHVLNSSFSSSDLSIDIGITSIAPPTPLQKPTRQRKCEIVPAWESDSITTFSNTIRIPASTIKPDRIYRVRCKMLDNTGRWGHWSAPVEFVAGTAQATAILDNLRITEVMYNPQGGSDYEFLEIKNLGQQSLDLSGVSISKGVTFDFSTSNVTTLAPGQFALIVSDQDAFESRYGTGQNIAGQFSASLSNSGETIELQEYYNGTIVKFQYNDSRGWPQTADGPGHSLIPVPEALAEANDGSLDFAGNFRASTYINGSPGADDPAKLAGLVINEVAAHTDYANPAKPQYDSNDWIELFNTSDAAVELNGDWYLSDDFDDLKKWALPSLTVTIGGLISFDEVNNFHSPITSGFGLDKAGEQIILSYLPGTTADRVVDYIHFKGQDNNFSLGRYTDGNDYMFTISPSRDSANNVPADHIVITEIMYHPLQDSGNDEYLKLYNPTGSSVDLENWRIDSSVGLTFSSGTIVEPGDPLYVVGFDPATETARLDDFITIYATGPLTPGENIVGPWTGNLSNGGERIAIERPLEPDMPDTTVPWLIVDEVIYGDFWPWPQGPDGTGMVLQRISASAEISANNPQNWTQVYPNGS